MSLKDTLTNEKLGQRFDNPFALVNYAISLAKVRVMRGEGMDSNPANDVLEAISLDEDKLDDIADEEENVEEAAE